MTEQPLNLRRSLQILGRHLITLVVFTALGALAGAGYAALHPPGYASSVLVALPSSTRNVPTQIVIATSIPVLTGALGSIHPAISLNALNDRVTATTPISGVISVNAKGQSPAQAESMANAVARSYVAYTNGPGSHGGRLRAGILQDATPAPGTSLLAQLLITGVTGAVAGVAAGTVVILAVGRGDRRLRLRDQLADAIGVPVLTSVRVRRPSDAAGWAALLGDYEPDAADTQRFRAAMRHLGLEGLLAGRDGRFSIGVLSFASDRRALALGPQLAVYAAAQGVRTELVISPRQDNITAALCAACESGISPGRPGRLRAIVADHDGPVLPGAILTIVVAVVDDDRPEMAGTWRTDATLLGVSSGVVTAEQMTRAAASAATDGRDISGILVADPDPADQTTGRFPQPERPIRNSMPTRMTGKLAVTRW
jgi:capsular polysaccharide biosynthesis protein